MAINERIRIILELVSNSFINPMAKANEKMRDFNGQLKDTSKSMLDSANKTNMAAKGTMKATKSNFGFLRVMRLNGDQFKELGKNQKALTSRTGKLAFAFRKGLHGMRGFKMEMLGVMFFGMSMVRMFGGLIKTSTGWLGVSELLSTALGILFLPLAEKLLDWVIKFLDWVSNLTEKQKAWINAFVLAAIAIGIVLTLVGTLVLGLGALVLAFSFLFSPIGLVISALTILGGFFFLKNMFKDIEKSTEGARIKLTTFGVSGEVFDKMKDKIIEWHGVLTEKFSGLKSKLGNWIGETLPVLIEGGADMLMSIIDGIVKNSSKVGEAIRKVIDKILTWIDNNSSKLIDLGENILDGILEGLLNSEDKIHDTLKKVINSIGIWIGNNSGKLVKLGLNLAAAIGEGLSIGIMNAIIGTIENVMNFFGVKTNNKRVSLLGGSMKHKNDFIWRPGQGATSINPNDTLVGFKGAPPNLGGGSNGSSQNITINASIGDDYDVRRMADKLKEYWVNDFEKTSQGRSI
jgi:hypothetical protein